MVNVLSSFRHLSKDQRALDHLTASNNGYMGGLLHLEKRSDRSLLECAVRMPSSADYTVSGGFIGCRKGYKGLGRWSEGNTEEHKQ